MSHETYLPGPVVLRHEHLPTARRRCPELGCGGAHGHAGAHVPEAVPPVAIADQPPPAPSEGRAIWALVVADMYERDRVGRARYGMPLRAGNGRDALVDAYQEALDLAVYLRQAVEERGR